MSEKICSTCGKPWEPASAHEGCMHYKPTEITSAEWLARKVDDLEAKLAIAIGALETGAFHHNSCPWLQGKECVCAHQRVREALEKLK